MDEVKRRDNSQFILLVFLGLVVIFVIGKMIEPEILSTIITSIFSLLYIIVLSYFWLGKPKLSNKPKSRAEMDKDMIEMVRLLKTNCRAIGPKFEKDEEIIYDQTLCTQINKYDWMPIMENRGVANIIVTNKRMIVGIADEFYVEERFGTWFQKTPENAKKIEYGKDEYGGYIITRLIATSRTYHPKSKEIYEFFTKI